MNKIKTHFGAQIVILSIALIVALPVRVYQYLHVIDGTTGFYNNWLNPTVFGLYGLCLVVLIVMPALSSKGGKKTIYAMPQGKKTSLGISALVTGLAFIAEGAYAAMRAYAIFSQKIQVEQLVLGNNAGKPTMLFTALQAAFAMLSAVYLFAFSVGYFTGKGQQKKVKILAIAPALWAVARLMLDFTQTISYRYVSELLFELLMIVFFAMFAVAFAKFTVGALTARLQMRLFGYGLLSIFFGMLSAVPRYIVLLMGRQDLLFKSISAFEVTDVILPVFIACVLFAAAGQKQYKAVEEYTAAAQQEE